MTSSVNTPSNSLAGERKTHTYLIVSDSGSRDVASVTEKEKEKELLSLP